MAELPEVDNERIAVTLEKLHYKPVSVILTVTPKGNAAEAKQRASDLNLNLKPRR